MLSVIIISSFRISHWGILGVVCFSTIGELLSEKSNYSPIHGVMAVTNLYLERGVFFFVYCLYVDEFYNGSRREDYH